jgi:hypothetical protein
MYSYHWVCPTHQAKGVHNHDITIAKCGKLVKQNALGVIGVLGIAGIIFHLGVHLSHQRVGFTNIRVRSDTP